MEKALAETIGANFERQLAEFRLLVSERDAIRGRLQKAQGERESVKDHIFERVSAEYEARLEALDQEMQPLSTALEQAAERLHTEIGTIAERISQAEDRMDEIVFRHRVGEFADEELDRKQEPLRNELDELTERRGTFDEKLEAIRSSGIAVADRPSPEVATDDVAADAPADDVATEPAPAAADEAEAEDVHVNDFAEAPETNTETKPDSANDEPRPEPAHDEPEAASAESGSEYTEPGEEPVDLDSFAEPMTDDFDLDASYGRRIDDTPVETVAADIEAEVEAAEQTAPAPQSEPQKPAAPSAPKPVAVANEVLNNHSQNLVDPTDWVDELVDPVETPHNDPAFAAMTDKASNANTARATQEAAAKGQEAAPDNYPVLIITKGPGSGRKLPLLPMTMTLGREHDNNIEIKDEDVARYHARISFQRGKYMLEDLDSASGTWVNGKRISESTLAHGDQIRVGGTEMAIAFSTSGAISAS